MSSVQICPCDTGRELDVCCGPRLDGSRPATTAVALMRSRYTAYVVGDAAYLLQTWSPEYRPSLLELDPTLHWTGLTVLATVGGKAWDDQGMVHFRACWEQDGQQGELHEVSSFVQVDHRWYYTTGIIPS